jgi:hypothetical protein
MLDYWTKHRKELLSLVEKTLEDFGYDLKEAITEYSPEDIAKLINEFNTIKRDLKEKLTDLEANVLKLKSAGKLKEVKIIMAATEQLSNILSKTL